VLLLGAGASIEEAKRANAPTEFWPPTIANFATKMWDSEHNKFFVYWLPEYLRDQGIDPGNDPTSRFIQLAQNPETHINVERLFEYCWLRKGRKFDRDWENLIYHGILSPLNFLLLMAFYENGEMKPLRAGTLIAGGLHDGDIVVNLNYDTLFEIAATRAGLVITYSPNTFRGGGLFVAKPHGSINLLADETHFWFAQPESIGALPSSADDFRNWRAIVPPRFNKSYEQHPIAAMILDSIRDARPEVVTFWGVGLTDSDADLLELYRVWVGASDVAEVINPDSNTLTVGRARDLLRVPIRHFLSPEDWRAGAPYRTESGK